MRPSKALKLDISQSIHFMFPVSVIVPIYNKEDYLNASLRTITKQTFRKFEVICIDDFSNDKSIDIILSFMKRDSRFKLIRHFYNQGTCISRIHGVLKSKSEYIFSYDPDDKLTPDAIKSNYMFAKQINADIVEYRIKSIFKNRRREYCLCRHNYTDNAGVLNRLKTYSINWNLAKKLIKREIFLQAIEVILPFVVNKRILAAEDLLLCGAIFFFIHNFYCNNHVSYYYYLNADDSSGSGKNQPVQQNLVQLYYMRSILSYFFKNAGDIRQCTPDKLFKQNQTILNLYNNITNISKTSYTDCPFNTDEFNIDNNIEEGYCFVTKIN